MSKGFTLVVFPVKDLSAAKALYSQLLGVEPYVDAPYYAGFRVDGQEIGLDPNGHAAGQTGPLAYVETDDIERRIDALVKAGAKLDQGIRSVGPNRRIARLKDADGNAIALMQTT